MDKIDWFDEREEIVNKLMRINDVDCIHLVDNDKQENISEVLKLSKVKISKWRILKRSQKMLLF